MVFFNYIFETFTRLVEHPDGLMNQVNNHNNELQNCFGLIFSE